MSRVYYGDIHGHIPSIHLMRQDHPDVDEIVIVGDIGFGFRDDAALAAALEGTPPIRFIRGNHDDPAVIARQKGYIPDGTIEDGILYVGGAWSIDGITGLPYFRGHRTIGVSWWEDEELSESQWMEIFSRLNEPHGEGIVADTIHTVVSHDGPDIVTMQLLPPHKDFYNTRTGEYLQELFTRLPNVTLWVFGHYHVDREMVLGGTVFRALRDSIDSYLYEKGENNG